MDKDDTHKCIEKEELLTQTRNNIEKFGLQVIMVSSTHYLPSFAYSVGLYETYNHPEIICFGFSNNLGHTIINDVAKLIRRGKSIKKNKINSEIFKNSKAMFLEVDSRNLQDYFFTAIEYYKANDFPALQLIWTDRNNKFPWEENFEKEFIYKQPLLDRNADFKFRESKNLGVFTTKQWLEEGKTITHVVHDDNGDWQFLTGNQVIEDAKIVALEQVVMKDKTLNELFNLDYGQEAKREVVGGHWIREKVLYEGE